jgi:hypothetical protein
MPYARRLIFVLSTALGGWVLASFAGAMLDPTRSAFWTSSLMWSLLTSLLLSPALLVVAHYVRQTAASDRNRRAARGRAESRKGDAGRVLRGPGATEAGGAETAGATDEPPRIWPEPQDEKQNRPSPEEVPPDEWPWNREDVERPE